MTHAFTENQAELEAHQQDPLQHVQLEVVPPFVEPTSNSNYPKYSSDLLEFAPDAIKQLDLRALETIGSIGLRSSFKLLHNWARFPVASQEHFDTLQHLPETTDRTMQINNAARYITKLRLYNILSSDPLPYTEEALKLPHQSYTDLYRHFRSQVERQPNEPVLRKQLQVAKISISAERIHRSLHEPPRPYTQSTQKLLDEARNKRPAARMRSRSPTRPSNMVKRYDT